MNLFVDHNGVLRTTYSPDLEITGLSFREQEYCQQLSFGSILSALLCGKPVLNPPVLFIDLIEE